MRSVNAYHEANDDDQQKYGQNDVANWKSAKCRIDAVNNDGHEQRNEQRYI